MNKLLLTSALTAVAFAGVAHAQIDAGVRGAYSFDVTYVDDDSDDTLQSVQYGQDWEFELNGSFEMDNGITAFADLEIDATGNSEAIRSDDIEFGLRGSFGTLGFGNFDYTDVSFDHVPALAITDDETAKVGTYPDFSDIGLGDTTNAYYRTPSIAGFSGSIGYQQGTDGTTNGSGEQDDRARTHDANEQMTAGLGYNGDFGGVGVAAGLAYTQNLNVIVGETDENTELSVGVSVSVSDFEITGAYATRNDDTDDENAIGLSAAYGTGPWGFAVGASMEEHDENDYENTAYGASVSYAFGPGVSFTLRALQSDVEQTGAADVSATEVRFRTTIGF